MIIIKSNGNQDNNKIKEYIVDTNAEIADLPTNPMYMGSTALVIESSSVYMLNGSGEWREL